MSYNPYDPTKDVVRVLPEGTWTELSIIQNGYWSSYAAGSVSNTIQGPALIVAGIVSMSSSGWSNVEISLDGGTVWTQIAVRSSMFGGVDSDNSGDNGAAVIEPMYIPPGSTFMIRVRATFNGSSTYEYGGAYQIKYKQL